MFEVITSEASYLKSLNVLIWHFAQSPKLIGDPPYVGSGGVIGKRDHRILFSDVISVSSESELLNRLPVMHDAPFRRKLNIRWQQLSKMKARLFSLVEIIFIFIKNATGFIWDICSYLLPNGYLIMTS